MQVIQMEGVSQGIPPYRGLTYASATSSDLLTTIVASVSGDLVLDSGVISVDTDMVPGAGQTQIADVYNASLGKRVSFSWEAAVGASTAMSWTMTDSNIWENMGLAFKAGFTQTNAGALTFTGVPTKSTGKVVSGALTFAGSISRAISKAITAAISFIGDLLDRPVVVGVNVSLLVQQPQDGSWWDLTGDVRANPGISYEYGIRSNGIMDRTGTTGRMGFDLDNDPRTSAYAAWWTAQKANYTTKVGGGPYTPGLKFV